MLKVDEGKIKEVLERGVEEVFVKSELEKKLRSGERLRIKLGIDPTGPNIHIGRATALRKLRAFQDMGHKAVFIVGDFTAQIGDASDKLSKRPMLTKKDIKKNLKDYKKQIGKIIDLRKAEFHFNSKWLSKLRFDDVALLAETFSVQQMLNRRNFSDRMEKQEEISLREFLYPLMQGYDSFAVKADFEIGGFDQLFNLKAGRIIQKHFGQKEQDIMTLQMLEGTDGRKMSTSWGNIITIVDEPSDMFGKVMTIRDELITKYFLLCTDYSREKISEIEDAIKNGQNPKNFKMELAKEIVRIYHGQKEAEKAEGFFVKTFEKKEIPDEVEEISFGEDKVADRLIKEKIVSSRTELIRLIKDGAITNLDKDKKVEREDDLKERGTYRIGKHRFIKVN
ncbi:MAG: tyrosine--tRNA ligase [Candidatus Pacebacteria bacterium]|nr:tyrosine--tRNA ligase [Candidatus Paceibacterota bacterium]